MWHEEAFHKLGVQGVEDFHQVWFQHLSVVLESRSSCCLLLCPSHHLGTLGDLIFDSLIRNTVIFYNFMNYFLSS
jgi:hypothetical protein